MKFVRRLCLLLLMCHPGAVLAAEIRLDCDPDCVEVGAWRFNVGLGLGLRSNPLYQGEDTPLVVLPELSYYGQRFFLKNLEMGFTLLESPRHQFNLLVTPSYDQMYFNRWDPLNFTGSGGPGASLSVSGGPRATYEVYLTSEPPNLSQYPETPGASVPPPSNGPTAPPGTSGVAASAAEGLYINDHPIDTSIGSQRLAGARGNNIDITVKDGAILVDGLTAGDTIDLINSGAVELSSRGGTIVNRGDDQTLAGDRLTRVSLDDNLYYNVETQPLPQTPDAFAPNRIAADEVRKRRLAGLAGVEYSYSLPWLQLHAQALSDFTGVHGGQEVRLAAILPWTLAEQRWALTLGANYKSRRVLDYYYGVDPRETSHPSLWFEVDSGGVETLLRLDWQKPLSDHWSLRAMLQYTRLPSEISYSPLLSKRDLGAVFFGGIYHF